MKPRILQDAENELLEAMLYYEECRQGLGVDSYDSVTEAILAIGNDPLRFPVYEGNRLSREFRRARVQGFPYIVVFEVREEDDPELGPVIEVVPHPHDAYDALRGRDSE
jgi:hypothetical protein